MEGKNLVPHSATGTNNGMEANHECRQCAKPGRVYNVSGQDELLCEEHYQRQISIFNDLGSN